MTEEHWKDAYKQAVDLAGLRQMRIDRLEAICRAYRTALEQIAEGKTPPEQHGHYLAHRACVQIARDALRTGDRA